MTSLSLVANLKGSQGVPGPQGIPGLENVPTDPGVAALVSLPSETRTALLDSLGLVIPIYGAGIDPTGATDSTSAIQAIIDAHPGRRLRLGAGVFKFTQITLSKGQHLEGAGQQDWRDRFSVFGSSGWMVNANFNGTVLRSTLTTTNAAITILDTEVNSGGICDLTLIGPGTGTSTGVSVGSDTVSVVNPLIRSVKIGNFSVGVTTKNVNEGSFYDLMIRGCTLALDLNTNTIQNAFHMLDVQWCGDGVHFVTSAVANAFYSPIGQSNTGTAFTVNGTKNVFYNPYCENNTTRAFDFVSGSGNRIDAPFCNNVSDSIRIQAAATDTSITGFGFAGGVGTLTNAGVRSYLQGNFAGALTDTGTNTTVVDAGLAGSAFAAWASYVPVLAGTGWALGNGTVVGRYTTVGKTVHFRGMITFGSTSTFGAASPTISTPFALIDRGDVQAFYTRSGVGGYALVPKFSNSGSTFTLWVAGTNGALAAFTSAVPATIASTDVIEFAGTFERA